MNFMIICVDALIMKIKRNKFGNEITKSVNASLPSEKELENNRYFGCSSHYK